jgi:hypothetical protein
MGIMLLSDKPVGKKIECVKALVYRRSSIGNPKNLEMP